MQHAIARLPSVLLVLLAACAAPVEEEEGETERSSSALQLENGLRPNGLRPNGLSPNGLRPNSLSPSALAAIQDPGEDGDLSRLLLQYTVSCALSQTQSFAFSWIDSAGVNHDEIYPGLMGIAPAWISAPLTQPNRQQLVSACLAARTNWYGERVVLSMRYFDGVLRILTETPEHLFYPYIEGAFWGNLFAPTPYLSACYVASNVAHSRAAHRDCAAGHVDDPAAPTDCGMIHVAGECRDICKPTLVAGLLGLLGQYYPECNDGVHGATTHVMTTALP